MRNRSKLPCPWACGSSNGATEFYYEEASKWFTKCHVCSRRKPLSLEFDVDELKRLHVATVKQGIRTTMHTPAHPMNETWRGITSDTFRKYGVLKTGEDLAFVYGEGFTKFRSMQGKEFKAKKDASQPFDVLFGQHLFPPGSAKTITITEGEIDCLSAYQMQGNFPVVSLPDGAGDNKGNTGAVTKALKAAYDYLQSFESIVISFDSDEPGQKAAEVAAELLGSKAKIMAKDPKAKDANDFLTQHRSKDYMKLWWAAKPYSPEGVVSFEELIPRMLEIKPNPPAFWHMRFLNEMLRGIFDKKLILITGGTGTGKSTFFRAVHYNLLKQTEAVSAGMYLEESGAETLERFCSLELGRAAHLGTDGHVTDAEKLKAAQIMADTHRIFLWDHFDSLSVDVVLKRMVYFVKVLGAKYIFLDHVSTVVAEASAKEGGERLLLDDFMTKLRHFVEANGCTVFIVAHVNRTGSQGKTAENGGQLTLASLRGSGALGQVPDVIIALERDQQAEDVQEAKRIRVRVLKNRPTGKVGMAGSMIYSFEKDCHEEEFLDHSVL